MQDDYVSRTIQIVDEAVECFLEKVNEISENGPFRKARKISTTFSLLKLANDEFYEYAYFERTVEWLTRDLLINFVMHRLFQTHGIECLWPECGHYAHYSTESIENIYPFEFIIDLDGEKTGVRYTGLTDEEVDDYIDKYEISNIILLKWGEELTRREEEQTRYEVLTPRSFFQRYFTSEEYDVYISKAIPAIEKANSNIGFETIPRLSLRYLYNFREDAIRLIETTDFERIRYKLLPDSKAKEPLNKMIFSEEDYEILNNNFKSMELYKALFGTEGFAKCFITAEYQYQVFTEDHRFDYTSVACGYLKAVEQLIHKLLQINLSNPVPDKLWILKNSLKIPKEKYIEKETVRSNPNTGKLQVIFNKEYEKYFNITLTPMIWFLHDNVNGWKISKDGRVTIHKFLLNFADEYRNDHFHKDNIDEFDVVSCIRNNAILIFYLLLGGYKLSGNHQRDLELLGVVDDSFDRMYKRIQKIPRGIFKFVIYFSNKEPIKAYRHFSQEKTVYDKKGSVSLSKIKFVEVDRFEKDEYDKAMQGEYASKEFTLRKDNMPTKISYINGLNEEVDIDW